MVITLLLPETSIFTHWSVVSMSNFNEAGEELIKKYEGLKLEPYQDSAGIWTIGYGHTHGVTKESPIINEQQAQEFLLDDLSLFCGQVEDFINGEMKADLNDNQFSALVCLAFNVGSAPLHKTLGAKLIAGDIQGAADEFYRWAYCEGRILQGLVMRRSDERALFLTPDD